MLIRTVLLNPLVDLGVNFEWEVFPRFELALLPTIARVHVRDKNQQGQKVSVHHSVERPRKILAILDVDISSKRNRYAPIQDFTGLFKTFASLPCTEASVLAFARRFGHLGRPLYELAKRGSRSQHLKGFLSEPVLAKFEFLEDWYNEIAHMQWLVDLWESSNVHAPPLEGLRITVADDYKSLAYIFSCADHSTGLHGIRFSGLISDGDMDGFQERAKSGIAGQRAIVLWHAVSHELAKHELLSRLLPTRAGASLAVTLSLCPSTLIDALWIQFASAISRRPRYRRCLRCPVFFEVRAASNRWGKRADAKFCSDNCRIRASERRGKRA